MSDVDSAMTANSAVQIQSLPVAGTLQTLVDGDWKSVAVSQIITKAAIDGESALCTGLRAKRV